VAHSVEEVADYTAGYEVVIARAPSLLFLDITQNPDQALKLVEQLAWEVSGLRIFVISDEKNPDLILRAVRLGVSDFFVLPGDEAVIERTVSSLKDAKEVKSARGNVLAVFSLLGGSGTSTLATNLAAFMAKGLGRRCVICDLDLYKGDVTYMLNLETDFTIIDFVQNINRVDEELRRSSMAQHPSGVFVLSHPRSFEDIEDVTGERITRVLQTLSLHFDSIVIDCPKAINDVFLAVMDAADTILLLTLQSVPALKNTKRCLDLFEQLGYDRGKIKVVLNRFIKEKIFSIDNIEKTLDWPVTATVSSGDQDAAEAVNAGRLIQEVRPKSKLSMEIADLGKMLTGEEPLPVERSKIFGFIRKGG
jgi:pilus assembly protein CpaE